MASKSEPNLKLAVHLEIKTVPDTEKWMFSAERRATGGNNTTV